MYSIKCQIHGCITTMLPLRTAIPWGIWYEINFFSNYHESKYGMYFWTCTFHKHYWFNVNIGLGDGLAPILVPSHHLNQYWFWYNTWSIKSDGVHFALQSDHGGTECRRVLHHYGSAHTGDVGWPDHGRWWTYQGELWWKVWTIITYSRTSLYHDHWLPKYSQKALHTSLVRSSYGVSFVDSKPDLYSTFVIFI